MAQTPLQIIINQLSNYKINGISTIETKEIIIMLNSYLPVEKQSHKNAFEAGMTKNGELIWNRDNNCNANNAPDFDEYYNQKYGQ